MEEEEEGGRLNERARDGRVALGGASNWPLDGSGDRERHLHTHTHTHTHTPFFPSLVSSASLPRSDKGKRVANLSFDEGGFPQTELT